IAAHGHAFRAPELALRSCRRLLMNPQKKRALRFSRSGSLLVHPFRVGRFHLAALGPVLDRSKIPRPAACTLVLGHVEAVHVDQASLDRPHRPAPRGGPKCLPVSCRTEPSGSSASHPGRKGPPAPEAMRAAAVLPSVV